MQFTWSHNIHNSMSWNTNHKHEVLVYRQYKDRYQCHWSDKLLLCTTQTWSDMFYVVGLLSFMLLSCFYSDQSKLFKSSIYFLKLSFLYLKVYLNLLHEIIFRFTSMYFRMTNVFPVPVGRSMRQFFPLRAEDRSSSWYSRRVTSPVGPAGTGITEPSLIMSFAETIKLSSFDSDVTTEPLSSECSAGTEIKC